MEKEELTQLFNFFREIDKEKFIGRQTYLTDGVRKENDAEHAWHMAIMTVLLAGYANEKIDVHIEQILNRNRNTAKGSEAIWEYAKEEFLRPNLENGKIKK